MSEPTTEAGRAYPTTENGESMLVNAEWHGPRCTVQRTGMYADCDCELVMAIVATEDEAAAIDSPTYRASREQCRIAEAERDALRAVALRLERECRNLRAEVARLREALEALLDNAETVYMGGHDVEAWTVQAMLNEDMRRARAVLAATERSER